MITVKINPTLRITKRRFWLKWKVNKLKTELYNDCLSYYKGCIIPNNPNYYHRSMYIIMNSFLLEKGIKIQYSLYPYYFKDWFKWRPFEGCDVGLTWFPINQYGLNQRIAIFEGLLLNL